MPLDQFDAWQQCKIPGVKADLTAVNLTAADKAGAFYLTQGKGAGAAGSPSPAAAADDEADAEGPTSLPEPQLPEDTEGAAAPSPAAFAAEPSEAAGLLEQLAPSPAPGVALGLEGSEGPEEDLVAAAPAPRRSLRRL